MVTKSTTEDPLTSIYMLCIATLFKKITSYKLDTNGTPDS